MNALKRGLTSCLGLALFAALPALADEVEKKEHATWAGDFDKATAQAKAEKKDLLVDFTGSDWCGWCIRLHDEVFAEKAFEDEAQKQYVLVALDFPKGEEAKAKVPNKARNQELAQKYGVEGFPTVLLMSPDGDVYGRLGWEDGGAANWLKSLAKARDAGRPKLTAAKAIADAAAAAKDADKPAVYDKAAAALLATEPGGVGMEMLVPIVKAAYQSDPENKSGLRARAAKALLASNAAEDEVVAWAAGQDPKNEAGLMEWVLVGKMGRLRSLDEVKAVVKEVDDLVAKGGPKDKAAAKRLYVNTMWLNHEHLKDAEKAKAYAKRVKELGFEGADEGLKKLVDDILGEEPEAAPPK